MRKEKVSREERMSEIQQKLENGVRDIFESDKYKEYISTMSKFPSYSINNCKCTCICINLRQISAPK